MKIGDCNCADWIRFVFRMETDSSPESVMATPEQLILQVLQFTWIFLEFILCILNSIVMWDSQVLRFLVEENHDVLKFWRIEWNGLGFISFCWKTTNLGLRCYWVWILFCVSLNWKKMTLEGWYYLLITVMFGPLATTSRWCCSPRLAQMERNHLVFCVC